MKPIISFPGDSPAFQATPLGGGKYIYPYRQFSSKAYEGDEVENYFWYVEDFAQSYQSFRPAARGDPAYDRMIPHPKTKQLVNCSLIDEIPPDESSGDGPMGIFKRVWSPAITPMHTWELYRFTRLSLDGLKSKTGDYYGVSYDNGQTNHVYSARREIEAIGRLEDLLIRAGGDEVFEPQGMLSLTFVDDSHDFTVDLSLSANEIKQTIIAQIGQDATVYKETSQVTISGVGIDEFSSITIEGITDGGGYGYVPTTGRVEISFVPSAATPTGQLTLIGGTTEVTATIPPKGSLSVFFVSGLETLDFTIPDLSASAAEIENWMIANTKFDEEVEVIKPLSPSVSGITIKGTQTLDPWVKASGQSMDVRFVSPYDIYDFTIPDVAASPSSITAWIEANTAFGVESQSSGGWVPEVAWLEVVFQTHPSIPDPIGNYLAAPSIGFSVDGFNVLATHEAPTQKVALHMQRRSDNNIDASSFASNLDSMVLTSGEYTGVTTTAQYDVIESALGVEWEVTDPIGGETIVELANPTVQLDVGSSVSALIAQLESMGATDVAITKDSDSISLYWAPAVPPVWISVDPAPTEIGIRWSTAYTSVEIGGASGKTVVMAFDGGIILLSYTAVAQGTLTRYNNPTSLRSFRVPVHLYDIGDPIPFWNGDALVAKSTVAEKTGNEVWVDVQDVSGTDFKATHIGNRDYLTILQGGDGLFDARITAEFYIEGQEGIVTGDNVPAVELEASAQKQLDVVSLGNEYFVAEVLEKGRVRETIQWMQRSLELKTLEVFGAYVVPSPDPVEPEEPDPDIIQFLIGTSFAIFALQRFGDYNGSVIRVNRSMDPQQSDIELTPDGNLDVAAIQAFAQGGSARTVLIYNQISNNFMNLQNPAAYGPTILDSGEIVGSALLPKMDFRGAYDHLQSPIYYYSKTFFTAPFTIFAVCQWVNKRGEFMGDDNLKWFTCGFKNDTTLRFTMGRSSVAEGVYPGNSHARMLHSVVFSSPGCKYYINGQLIFENMTDPSGLPYDINDYFIIGGSDSGYFGGTMEMLVMAQGDLTDKLPDIHAALNEKYTVY